MMSAMSTSSSTTRMFMGMSFFLDRPRKLDHEAGAARHAVFYSHRSSVQVDQGFDDCQAQATARFTALQRAAPAIELVEDDVPLRLGHARTVVRHGQRHVAVH